MVTAMRRLAGCMPAGGFRAAMIGVGVAAMLMASVPVEADPIVISTRDDDRNGIGGRFNQGGINGLNAEAWANAADPQKNRGWNTNVSAQSRILITYIRFDLSSLTGPIADAQFSGILATNPATAGDPFIIDFHGLTPGHDQELWMEGDGQPGGVTGPTPPNALVWENAPALDQATSSLINDELFAGGAVLGSLTLLEGMAAGTSDSQILSFFGGEGSSLVNFINAAWASDNQVATFIMVASDPEDARVGSLRSKDSGTSYLAPTLTMNLAIPEPATAALFGLSGLGLLARRRRGMDL